MAPLKAAIQNARSQPLPYLQGLFGPWVLQRRPWSRRNAAPADRRRVFPLELTFWAFLSQILNPGASCREAVRQVLALFCLAGKDTVDEQTGGYLPSPPAPDPLNAVAASHGTHRPSRRRRFPQEGVYGGAARSKWSMAARPPLPDTSANQKVFPQQRMQKPGCGFPIMRFVSACFPWPRLPGRRGDRQLLRRRIEPDCSTKLWHFLKPRDVLLADRHFSDYGTLAALWNWGVDAVMRMNQQRPRDFRQGQYLEAPATGSSLGKNLPNAPAAVSLRLWASLPEILTLRMIRVRCATKEISHPRTDPGHHPAGPGKNIRVTEIAQLFLQRWNVELFFRDLKTILKMEHLRCTKSPTMVQKELSSCI